MVSSQMIKRKMQNRNKKRKQKKKYQQKKTKMDCVEGEMDCIAFKHLFEEYGDITPKDYNENTEVVVCRLDDDKSGQVFGVSKCKGGSRYGTFEIEKMDIIFFPKQRKIRIWFGVDGW